MPRFILTIIQNLFTNYIPVFLGTCEKGVEIAIEPGWAAVESDLGGSQLPAERLAEGEEATIRGNLTRFNWPVYLALAARSQNTTLLGTSPGLSRTGNAMFAEGVAYPLWLVFPYTAKPVYYFGYQPAGYRFFSCFLEGPDRIRPSVRPLSIELTWRAQRLLVWNEVGTSAGQIQPTYASIPLVSGTDIIPIVPLPGLDADNAVTILYDDDMSNLLVPN